jgi:chemotaxis protein CheX
MNVKFLNPFIEAAYEVLLAETGLNSTRGELALDKHLYVTDDVTVLLSLVGHVEGSVFYSMNNATAMGLVSRMLGETLAEFSGLAQSGVAELGNVITGRASVKLAEAGYGTNISPPTLLTGKGASLSTLDMARLIVPLHHDLGAITIHLALRENARYAAAATATLPVPAKPNV